MLISSAALENRGVAGGIPHRRTALKTKSGRKAGENWQDWAIIRLSGGTFLPYGILVEGVGTDVLLVRPDYRSQFGANLPEIRLITQFGEDAKIQEGRAVVDAYFAAREYDFQPVTAQGFDALDLWIHDLVFCTIAVLSRSV
jgi:hypothetical protein